MLTLTQRLGLTENRNQTEITQEASSVWGHMTPQQKAPWDALAQADKEEHKAKHPHYTFKPSRSPSSSVAAASGSYDCTRSMKVEDDDEAYSPSSRTSRRSWKTQPRASSYVSESSYESNPSAAPSSSPSAQYSPTSSSTYSASPFSTCSSSPSSTSSLELTTTWPNHPHYSTFDSTLNQSYDILPMLEHNDSLFSSDMGADCYLQPSTGPEWHETTCLLDPTIQMDQQSTWSHLAPNHFSQSSDPLFQFSSENIASTSYDHSLSQQAWNPLFTQQTPTSASFPPSLYIDTSSSGYIPSTQRTRQHRSATITPATSSYPPTTHLMNSTSGAVAEDPVWDWLHKPADLTTHAVYASTAVSSIQGAMTMQAHFQAPTRSSSSSLYGALGDGTAAGHNAK
jgi:hypothetical protein